MKDQAKLIQELLVRIDRLEKENVLLKEQNAYLMNKLYGQKSETSASIGLSVDEESLSLEEMKPAVNESSTEKPTIKPSKKNFTDKEKNSFLA